jgi:hypothetical protein
VTQSYWPIFNPRIQPWSQNFVWNEYATLIIGTSPIGRSSTVRLLKLNRDKLIEYRMALLPFGEHPPKFTDN